MTMPSNVAVYIPDRFVPILASIFFALIGMYVCLLVATVFFAARQAELANTLLLSEAEVAVLETEYLAKVKEVTARPLADAGFVRPQRTHYATAVSGALSHAH